jgi:hypothetical protein
MSQPSPKVWVRGPEGLSQLPNKKEYTKMRTLLLAAAATVAIAAPAAAKDGSPYVGIEGGILFPQKQTVFGSVDFTDPTLTDISRTDVASVRIQKG